MPVVNVSKGYHSQEALKVKARKLETSIALEAYGEAANIDINLIPKGLGVVNIGAGLTLSGDITLNSLAANRMLYTNSSSELSVANTLTFDDSTNTLALSGQQIITGSSQIDDVVITDTLRVSGASTLSNTTYTGDVNFQENTAFFDENVQTVAISAATIDLTLVNHATLDCSSATADILLNITVPTSRQLGTIIVKQTTPARDITFNPSAGTIKWQGTEPTWSGDINKYRIISYCYNFAESILHLSSTGTD